MLKMYYKSILNRQCATSAYLAYFLGIITPAQYAQITKTPTKVRA